MPLIPIERAGDSGVQPIDIQLKRLTPMPKPPRKDKRYGTGSVSDLGIHQ